MKIVRTGIVLAILAFGLSAAAPADPFPTPPFLENNVAFWKMIYTEVSLAEGLLHDADYPMVVFARLPGRHDFPNVKAERKRITAMLTTIATTPDSTWTDAERRIVDLYRKNGDTAGLPGAADRVRFQQGQKERFLDGFRRSGMYLDTIRAILRAYELPEKIAYLPHVESSFNTAAYSKVGAAGLWQFMRSTGRSYGLKTTYLLDERRDPVKATVAAARYLANAHERLGTWPLAITSYNHGVQGMRRAVAQTGSNDIAVIFNRYSSPSFRFASKNFYSCFLAACEIAENHERYFPSVEPLPPLRYVDVQPGAVVTASVICRYFDISPQEFAALNPEIRPVVISHDRQLPADMTIHLPATMDRQEYKTAFAAIPDSLKSIEISKPHYYRIRRGDNLSSIAAQLGVSLRDLILENDLSVRDRIYAGQMLRVPVGVAVLAGASTPKSPPVTKEEPVIVAAAATSIQRKSKAQVSVDSAVVLAPAVAEESPPPSRMLDYRGFDPEVYGLETVPGNGEGMVTVRVAVDETMSHFCDWLLVRSATIRRLNRMRPNEALRIGQRLKLPVRDSSAFESFLTARLEYHLAIEEDFYSQFKVVDAGKRVVKAGETVWTLCNDGEKAIPMWLFKKYNRQSDLASLRRDDTLWMPVVAERTAEERDELMRNVVECGRYRPLFEKGVPRPVKRVP